MLETITRSQIDIVNSKEGSYTLRAYLNQARAQLDEQNRASIPVALFDTRKLIGPFRDRYRVDHPILSEHQPERNHVLAVAPEVLLYRLSEDFGVDLEHLQELTKGLHFSILQGLKGLVTKPSSGFVTNNLEMSKFNDSMLRIELFGTSSRPEQVVLGFIDTNSSDETSIWQTLRS